MLFRSLLTMFRAIPFSCDLYRSNKLLLNLIIYHKLNISKVSNLIKLPQHKIVEELYPDNKSTISYKSIVRILKKRIIDCENLKNLRRLHFFIIHLLSGKLPCYKQNNILHTKYIPAYVLNLEYLDFIFLLNPALIFAPIKHHLDNAHTDNNKKFLHDNKKQLKKIMSLVQDTFYMARVFAVDEKIIKDGLSKAKNFDLLLHLHNEVMGISHTGQRQGLRKDAKTINISHIEPPLPATENITPIRSYSNFIDESNEMEHCLANARYIYAVEEGRSYIYSVKTQNDRCTLELGISKHNTFYIKQLQGRNNAEPAADTYQLVNAWLSDFR